MAWTYSDWVTNEIGTALRLSRLRLHIQEVSDKISSPNFTHQGSSMDRAFMQTYLDNLLGMEAREAESTSLATGTKPAFVKGRPSY